ncbi:MAG: hypothetical protein OEZ01_10640 [Candidatus Heimdallarchaeota archaeon]|nr:hypothetical protein [Candidatus Heimdallarchaeota archaeon]
MKGVPVTEVLIVCPSCLSDLHIENQNVAQQLNQANRERVKNVNKRAIYVYIGIGVIALIFFLLNPID